MLLARMPSLSSFLPTANPGEAALDEEGGDPSIAGFRVDGRKDDEEVGFVGVGDPELPAGQHEIATRFHGAGRQREGVAARAGFRERVGADGAGARCGRYRCAGRRSPSAAGR